jgi:hypothetical protein
MDGAGYLSKIFCTLATITSYSGVSMKVQIYVDGEVTPSIDAAIEDMGCFRLGTCSADRAGGGVATGNGVSFFFNFVAPFTTHIKVVFVDMINDGNDRYLGGYVEYKLGNNLSWGVYGKLWSSTMNYTVTPYSTQTLLNVSSATGGVFIGGYYVLSGQSDMHYLEGWINAIIDGGANSNWVNGASGAQVPTTNYKYDSNEDYGLDGFYFSASGGIHNQTREAGLTYTPSSGQVAFYRWHIEDPIYFNSSFQFTFTNGASGLYPTTQNTTVQGILWYYTAAVSGSGPTVLKGDTGSTGASGTPGTPGGATGVPGATGATGASTLTPIGQHDATNFPLVLYQFANNGSDSSGNGNDLTAVDSSQVYGLLGEGSSTIKGLYFSSAAGTITQRSTRTPALDINGDITIAFMMRMNSAPTHTGVILDYSDTARNSVSTQTLYALLITSAGRLRFQWEYGGTNTNFNDFTEPLRAGEIVHVVVTRSGTAPNIVLSMYLDGILVSTISGISNPPNGSSFAQHLSLGEFYGDSSTSFNLQNVMLSSVAIYNSALNAGQALALAQRCVGVLGLGVTQGATGLQGATGSPGATGSSGSPGGATGATGNPGATGSPGATGLGATGSPGATGTPGATGSPGSTGATGVGATGSTGANGPAADYTDQRTLAASGAGGFVTALTIPGPTNDKAYSQNIGVDVYIGLNTSPYTQTLHRVNYVARYVSGTLTLIQTLISVSSSRVSVTVSGSNILVQVQQDASAGSGYQYYSRAFVETLSGLMV